MDGKTVLSHVVEVDCAQVLNDVELVGVVAETLTRGKLAVRIERVGRPEVKNMLLAPKQFDRVNRDLEIRDLYNMRSEEHTSELQSHSDLVCRLLLEKKKKKYKT